jgi:hypothetical protein
MTARTRPRPTNALALGALAAFVFLFASLYRGLSPKLTDDDFLFLSRGRQILQYGELPCRDFLDEGRPLQYVASAAGLAIGGDRLLGEIVIDVTLLALASALTVWLAVRLSGSAIAGLLAGLLVTLLGPRLYNYPKYALPVVGLLLLWRYADAKRPRALTAAALFTAFAFVFRHDFGGYLGVAGAVTIAVAHWGDGVRVVCRQVARFAAVAILGVLPYLVYLQVYEGVVHWADVILISTRDGAALSRRMADRFHVTVDLVDGRLRIERPRAHEFITDLVEAFPGEIDAVTFGKPTLEDVFVHHTGRRLD